MYDYDERKYNKAVKMLAEQVIAMAELDGGEYDVADDYLEVAAEEIMSIVQEHFNK
jgi:hypothetical protein